MFCYENPIETSFTQKGRTSKNEIKNVWIETNGCESCRREFNSMNNVNNTLLSLRLLVEYGMRTMLN